MTIRFTHNDKDYEVDMEAYDQNRAIVLPDSTILDVGMWLESMPPQPANMQERQELSLGSSPEETARLIGGIVATET